MKLIHLLGVAALPLAAGCVSGHASSTDHWSMASISPRAGRAFIGYDQNHDGPSYLDFQWQRKQEVSLTVLRHFFNYNPDNPFKSESSSYPAPRPPNSILPNPLSYFHLTLVDGPIATFDRGGPSEFVAGIERTFEPLSVVVGSILYDGLGVPNAAEQRGETEPGPRPMLPPPR